MTSNDEAAVKDEKTDVTSMCRVCMDDLQGELISVFQRVREETIAYMITDCANVDVSEHDILPKQCCERCVEGMYIAYSMRKQCRDSDVKLKGLLKDIDPYIKKEYDPTFETVHLDEPDFLKSELSECDTPGSHRTDDELVEGECRSEAEDTEEEEEEQEHENNDDNGSESSEESESNSSDSEDNEKDTEESEEEDIKPAVENENTGSDDNEDGNDGSKQHTTIDIKQGKRCCSCRHDFDSNELLLEHSRKVHLPDKTTDTTKPFECDLCYKRYFKKTSLNRHKRTTYSNIRARYKKITGTRCCGCKEDFDTEEILLEHSASVHGPDRTQDASKPYECELCFKRYITKNSLHRHRRKKYTNTRPRVCRKLTGNRCCGCKEEFESKEALMQHSQEIHFPDKIHPFGAKQMECDICYNRYASKRSLLRHKTRIYLERIYQCMQCDKSFMRRSILNSHEKKVHFGVKQGSLLSGIYQCAHCGKTFMQQSTLNNHEKIHSEVKPFVCHVCSKGFSSKGNLQTHIKLHSASTETHPCPTCGKVFRKTELLKSHMQSHVKEKQYECSVCHTKFKTANYLDIHARVHTGEKPYQCEYCDKTFAHSSGHRRHLLTHTGEKPFVCKFCGKDFASRPNMLIHEKLHTGEKNSTCDICGKQFVHARYMKSHRRMHFRPKNLSNLPNMPNIVNLPHFQP